MCEIAKTERRSYRDQDPPRILDADRGPFGKLDSIKVSRTFDRDSGTSPSAGAAAAAARLEDVEEEPDAQVPFPCAPTAVLSKEHQQVVTNGTKKEAQEPSTNGREMAPVMGVPPPPPAPDMSPDGLILPRKPYNPCLISGNHKDLRRELQFNQKVGKNVLNQKSELQRAMEKQREAALRKEAERNREESYKDDPSTALQRVLEQRAKQIELTEQPQNVEPPNPLVTARAKLRPRTDS